MGISNRLDRRVPVFGHFYTYHQQLFPMIRLTCAAIFLICSTTMGANAAGYASSAEIQAACAKPMPQVVTKELAAHLAKGKKPFPACQRSPAPRCCLATRAIGC